MNLAKREGHGRLEHGGIGRGKRPKKVDLFWCFLKMAQASHAHLNFRKRHFFSVLNTCPALEFQMAEQLA
ncbi:hypothetical protein EHI47_24030 [Rhizobium leguminosarum]|uniref:Uncharacterized protein n=2 Tax=Rhizobium TaxID=379 RepID=A0A444HSP8_RHILE|nr:hypothetical protein [Rhizobium leguminosarum bv. viciae]RWX15717.1 hypothetical protein EHI45_09820 [Rhizobium leguminosarum]TBE72673.1 hypothetical protein ELH03_18820 [Rhizobium beringeri]RWX26145.1 hypothetical protein EHI47_24030 [Rhizobium leguminosarum]TAU54747.1 hypothetical protein ELI43_18940 [Rhizobium leguminosarum]